ncbi:MAG: D-glycero-beta-D-manno-heptose 1-phosphate adenylyltransferase [Candidatus Aminicenantes bacterium]|nr:D-glycero-beta-D-manno-heptose 1-phosphate adenylyltransferase [Candidatus Aminicenantes bacterium]
MTSRSGTGHKIRTPGSLKRIRARLRREGKRVVFTNGCFDLIHGGHIHLFRWAKKQGDVLLVALNTDASVRRLKGPTRPVFPLAERMEVLAAIADIDYLVSFGEDTPRRLIAELLPDVLVKGGDWGPGEIVGAEEVEAAGGRVVRVPYLKGHSSTDLIEKILRDFGQKGDGSIFRKKMP